MKNVIILGASGSLASYVIDELVKKDDVNLTLFLRDKSKLRNGNISRCTIIEGDALDYQSLKDTIEGQDIVYGNLAGDLGKMGREYHSSHGRVWRQ